VTRVRDMNTMSLSQDGDFSKPTNKTTSHPTSHDFVSKSIPNTPNHDKHSLSKATLTTLSNGDSNSTNQIVKTTTSTSLGPESNSMTTLSTPTRGHRNSVSLGSGSNSNHLAQTQSLARTTFDLHNSQPPTQLQESDNFQLSVEYMSSTDTLSSTSLTDVNTTVTRHPRNTNSGRFSATNILSQQPSNQRTQSLGSEQNPNQNVHPGQSFPSNSLYGENAISLPPSLGRSPSAQYEIESKCVEPNSLSTSISSLDEPDAAMFILPFDFIEHYYL